ncbi:MAG: hypothetical protein IJC81_00365 [Clostridia bacterium]|nr:hypothetical protein [Clostridia bacterium]
MNMPLIITDAEGNLLYASRGVTVSGALRLWLGTAAKCYKDPVVYMDSNPIVVRSVLLAGKKYYFFVEKQKLVNCFGIDESRIGDKFFDSFDGKWGNRVFVSLKMLVNTFSRAYSEDLFDAGVRVSQRLLAKDVFVNVSPTAFVLCLALMTRLCAESGCEVRLSCVNDDGRAVVYADCVRGTPIKTPEREVLRVLLYEVAASAGFKIEGRLAAGKWSYKIETSPVDIGLYGFKADSLERFENVFKAYISMFL